jgi:hypothetical protein
MFRFINLFLTFTIFLSFSSLLFAQDSFDSFMELEGNTDIKNTNKVYKKNNTNNKVVSVNIVNSYVNKYGNIKITKIPKEFPKNLKTLDIFVKETAQKINNNSNNRVNSTNNRQYVNITSILRGSPVITNGRFVYKNQAGWEIGGSKHYSFSFVNPAYPNYSHMHVYRDNADTDAKNDAYAYCNSRGITYKSTSPSIYILPVVENFRQDFILKETKCCDKTKYYNIIYQSGDIVCYFYQYPE